jgi:hypothetical protein
MSSKKTKHEVGNISASKQFLLGLFVESEDKVTCYSETLLDFQRTTQKIHLFINIDVRTSDTRR